MAKANIMIVEDDAITAMDVENQLKNLGYGVSAKVSSGEDAIQKAKENMPDLVLMDIVLKGEMDGIEAAEEIRTQVDIPVVFLTAFADKDRIERAKITMPFGFILKPFQERELHTTIGMALYKHKMESRIKESERWLSAVLQGIGDAVIATDAQGCVKFLNPVAEELNGWKQEDALGLDS